VHGTVYNISSGAVKWLGPHPRLQEIVQAEMPLHVWNTTPYVRSEAAAPSERVEEIITRLKEGNERFMNGETLSADGQNKGSLSSLEMTVEFDVGKVTKFEDGIAPPPRPWNPWRQTRQIDVDLSRFPSPISEGAAH